MANNGQLQIAFTKTAEKQNRLKVLKAQYREILEDNPQWTKLKEQLETLNFQKKTILQTTSDANPKLMDELVALGADLKGEQELLADVAIKEFMETGECKPQDTDGNVYYPVFSVKFKKEKEAEKE